MSDSTMNLPALLDCLRAVAISMHIDPPALAHDDSLPSRAQYSYGTVTIRSDADCGVIVHELAHHRQFRDYGIAADWDEWLARELDAHRIEATWRAQ